MKKRVTVVGAGGTGCCTAAELTLLGHCVTLCEEDGACRENMENIRKRGGFELTGHSTVGFAEIDCVTNDFGKAVPGAEIIIIAAISTRHEALSKDIVPYLDDGQTVLFSAGSCGSIIFRQAIREAESDKRVVVGELEGNIFPCRIRGEATGYIGMPCENPKIVAAFPAKDNLMLLDAVRQLYDCEAATNVFETALNASNIIVHLGGSILNTGSVESMENFCFYDKGLTPSVLRIISALGDERDAICKKLGYKIRSSVGFMRQLADKQEYPQLCGFRGLEGPLSMQDRYIFEDASNGAAFLSSLGDAVDSPAPLARAFVAIASAINGEDYYGQGRTLDKLRMGGLNASQINDYLNCGHLFAAPRQCGSRSQFYHFCS